MFEEMVWEEEGCVCVWGGCFAQIVYGPASVTQERFLFLIGFANRFNTHKI